MVRATKLLLGLWMTAVIVAALLWPEPAKGFVGESSRIVFFHVPCAWTAFIAFVVAAAFSVAYLRTRRPEHDERAAAAVRLGLLFSILATVTGSVFARVMWGSYWNWDPRETSIVLLLFLYAAYLFLRAAVPDPGRRATFCAAYAVFAAIIMPFLIFVAPRVTASLHPQTVINPEGKILMDVPTKTVFFASNTGFTALFFWMLSVDARLARIERLKKSRVRASETAPSQ